LEVNGLEEHRLNRESAPQLIPEMAVGSNALMDIFCIELNFIQMLDRFY